MTNSVFKMINFVSEMIKVVLKMVKFVFKMVMPCEGDPLVRHPGLGAVSMQSTVCRMDSNHLGPVGMKSIILGLFWAEFWPTLTQVDDGVSRPRKCTSDPPLVFPQRSSSFEQRFCLWLYS